MRPTTYNSALIVMSVIMLSFIAYVSSKQSDRRVEQQNQWNEMCQDVANGNDFIAQNGECYIKWSNF